MKTEKPQIEAFFDEPTFTVSYLVGDPVSSQAVVIDPVLDFNPNSGKAECRSADAILAAAAARGWRIAIVLETHAHADHMTAAPYLKAKAGAKVAIGEHIRQVQNVFRPVFEIEDLMPDAGDFDLLLADGERLKVGEMEIEVLHTPGHTPRRRQLPDR